MLCNVLIIGKSRYGKSSVAEAIALAYLAAGVTVVVLEPFYTGRKWTGCIVVRTAKEFFALVYTLKDCALFVEEYARALQSDYAAGDTPAVAHKKRMEVEEKMILLSTSGRHELGPRQMGHVTHYSCHRLVQFDVTLRDQCPELYMFSVSSDDADRLEKDYGMNEGILLEGPSLLPGEFDHVEPGSEIERLEIDFATLEIRERNGRRSWKPEAKD